MAQLLQINNKLYVGHYYAPIAHRTPFKKSTNHNQPQPQPLYPYYWEIDTSTTAYTDGEDVWVIPKQSQGSKTNKTLKIKLKRSEWKFIQDHNIPHDSEGYMLDEQGNRILAKVGVPDEQG